MSKGNPLLELVSQLNEGDFSATTAKPKTTKRKRGAAKSRTAGPEIAPPPHQAVYGPSPGDTVFAQNPFDDYSAYRQHFLPKMRPGLPPNMQNMPMMTSQGKMYPPNQSTIFNATNPNAPPIYPCGVCRKEVHDNDQAILCESGCNFWYHRICTGLTDTAYHMLTQEVYAEWVCDKCVAIKNIPLVKMKP